MVTEVYSYLHEDECELLAEATRCKHCFHLSCFHAWDQVYGYNCILCDDYHGGDGTDPFTLPSDYKP